MARAGLPPALRSTGLAALALGGIMALLGASSAELENVGQATAWSTAAFVAGLVGALLVAAGAALSWRSG